MELEFDKEIDALMRKGLAGRLSTGEVLNAHLDADELSAFAENAMPERSRALYMAHLADCDRCRRILSNLIVLNSEEIAGTAAVAAPAISVAAEPWYRRLFLFPNLAYVMGGLVLVFGGLITISLLRTTMSDGSVAVSQATDTQPAARGPMSLDEPAYSSSANMASNAANAAAANTTHTVNSNSASTTSSSAAANAPGTGTLGETSVAREEVDKENRPDAGVTLDGVDAAKPAAAAPLPAPVATPEGYARERSPKDLDDSKKEDKLSARSVTEPEAKKRAADENLLKSAPRSQAGGPAKSKSGASRDAQQQFPDRANNTYDFPITKNVSGKGFQFRNGAWYDNAYRGQSTTNIRRRTDEYKNLNSGVRVIAESLSGVVVVVWKDKAYRIQ